MITILDNVAPDANFRFPFKILVDDNVWAILAADAGIDSSLSERARCPLDILISDARRRNSSGVKNNGGMIPSMVKKELEKLADSALNLAEGVKKLRDDDAAWYALQRGGLNQANKTVATWDMDADLTAYIENIMRLQTWLTKAVISAPKGNPGQESTLRWLIKRLDGWHIEFGGEGLVRSSEPSKRDGQASGHYDFVVEVIKLAGIKATKWTIDDAMKAAIRKRNRRVG